ncbi:hypothetical protein MPDQ_004027 [Monascus purpureus]|uniref:DUF7871 domain-containing protein n=1 Tax=Monascus purpureus TaxID=5098 RepID=A0A507QKD7_MONPU|nr:hypothetical protein MPDQ_004027 [Monascus purpureus]BDD54941.1 hypothetical protein MAP00_000508 [Monascus purpureus]
MVSHHVPLSCCKNSQDGSCICAAQAKCSCGKENALHCTCDKASSENTITGSRCSCRARPAGQCTCERAATENQPVSGDACPCGRRPSSSCTCEKAAAVDTAAEALETDFTSRHPHD